MADASKFLSGLFGDRPDGRVLIWTMPDKRSHWFVDPSQAAGAGERLSQDHDVYVGVALGRKTVQFSMSERAKYGQLAGLSTLWLDIDIAGPLHKKANLPPTVEDATRLLADAPAPPSAVIHSGHGLQAWWFLDAMLMFDADADEARAKAASKDWTYAAAERARRHGWTVDPTWDLTRVLRLPGTYNRKDPKDIVPVRILKWEPDTRHSFEALERLVHGAADTYQGQGRGRASAGLPGALPLTPEAVAPGSLRLDPHAEPSLTKFLALSENEPKFKRAWERKRQDLPDQSASSYDMALANYAAMAQWTDQEIADLLIAWRRKHSEDLKLRDDYYRRTIAKARAPYTQTEAQEKLEENTDALRSGRADPGDARAKIREALSQTFGIVITRVVKYRADKPLYKLETDVGSIILGEVSTITNQIAFRNSVAAATGRLIPKVKGDKWDIHAQGILDACELDELGPETTLLGQAKGWLDAYLDDAAVIDADVSEAAESRAPFSKEGRVHIFGPALRQWLAVRFERVTPKEMGVALRALGCEPVVVAVNIKSKDTSRAVWRVPKSLTETDAKVRDEQPQGTPK